MIADSHLLACVCVLFVIHPSIAYAGVGIICLSSQMYYQYWSILICFLYLWLMILSIFTLFLIAMQWLQTHEPILFADDFSINLSTLSWNKNQLPGCASSFNEFNLFVSTVSFFFRRVLFLSFVFLWTSSFLISHNWTNSEGITWTTDAQHKYYWSCRFSLVFAHLDSSNNFIHFWEMCPANMWDYPIFSCVIIALWYFCGNLFIFTLLFSIQSAMTIHKVSFSLWSVLSLSNFFQSFVKNCLCHFVLDSGLYCIKWTLVSLLPQRVHLSSLCCCSFKSFTWVGSITLQIFVNTTSLFMCCNDSVRHFH